MSSTTPIVVPSPNGRFGIRDAVDVLRSGSALDAVEAGITPVERKPGDNSVGYGAAACTGRGELAIRACTAFSVVSHLRSGEVLDDACRLALEDALALVDPYAGHFSLVALDRSGNAAAWSSRKSTYIAMTPNMSEPEARPRRVLGPTRLPHT